MNIVVYSLMTYAITAVISFAVIGFVVLMAKAKMFNSADADS